MKRLRVTTAAALVGLLLGTLGCETFGKKSEVEQAQIDQYTLAKQKAAEQDYEGASAILSTLGADASAKNRSDALLLLGDCRMKLEDYAGAQLAYQQAQQAPRNDAINARAKAGLGDAMMAQKRYGEAAVAYEKALSLSPGDINAPQVLLYLGKAYIRVGRWKLGRDRLTKLTTRYKSAPQVPEARDIITMPSDTYSVQVAAYAARSNAEAMVRKLEEHKIYGARIVDRDYSNAPFAVRVRHFVSYDQARAEAEKLKAISPEAYVVP